MEDLFSQIGCTSNSDSIVMRILRSAMDKAHEKLQSRAGPIEFIHERSTFYELAAVLVEGGLNIVQEETDILEGGCDKIVSDLMEIRHWLQGRIQDMKRLIIEKDKELMETLENESKLRQALELRDREIDYLHQKFEPERMKNEEIQDRAAEVDINKLKNSVNQQVWNIKQKLEDEKNSLTTEARKRTSRLSSPDLSFDFLDRQRDENSVLTEEYSCEVGLFSRIKPRSEFLRTDQNVLIRQMSSDIDILKDTLELAFGRMQCPELLPLEKQWRWIIERDIEKILVKGFVTDVQESSCLELKKEVGLFKYNWSEDFIDEIRILCHELKAICSTNSELLPNISYAENLFEDDTEADGRHYMATRNQLAREAPQRKGLSSWIKRRESTEDQKQKQGITLERRMQDVITRLDNLIKKDHNPADHMAVKHRATTHDNRIFEEAVGELKEEKYGFYLQIAMMEETYKLLFQGWLKDFIKQFDFEDTERLMKNDVLCKLESSASTQILLDCMERTIREDLYVIFLQRTVEEWKNLRDERSLNKKRREIVSDESSLDSILQESLGSLLKEDIYMVFFREMAEAWKTEAETIAIENLIRTDIYQFVLLEAVKDSRVWLMKSEALTGLDFQQLTPRSRKWDSQEGTPRCRRLDTDSSHDGTPRSRKSFMDGEEGLIHKLDSLLKCLETEEYLMLSASSEIKEHTASNNLVILNCEEMEERKAIEWLLTDDESTFSSVSGKLERALQQLYTSKDLLVELEQSLEVSDDSGENYHQVQHSNHKMIFEHEKPHLFLEKEDDQVFEVVPSDNVLATITLFQQVLGDVELVVHENLESKCLRLERLKLQVDKLKKPMASIRARMSLYEKAFISRCHNLKLAEAEVDLLGDQVEALLCLLERIYVVLKQNATTLSCYFQVYDVLKFIEKELMLHTRCAEDRRQIMN